MAILDGVSATADVPDEPVRPPGASDGSPIRLGRPSGRPSAEPVVPPDALGDEGARDRGARAPRWDNPRARTRASVTTFGLVGRVVLTVLLVAGLVLLVTGNLVFFVAGAVPYLVVMVMVLRDVWKRAPIGAPAPPRAPRATARSGGGLAPPPFRSASRPPVPRPGPADPGS